MRVILLQDVAGVGERYALVKVSDGYARNFLIPGKLAELADSDAGRRLEKLREKLIVEKAVSEKILKNNLNKLTDAVFVISEPANEKGSLFASITALKVADAIKREKGFEV